jgi:hypothetical protein
MQNRLWTARSQLAAALITEGFRRKKFEVVWNTRRKQMFRRVSDACIAPPE